MESEDYIGKCLNGQANTNFDGTKQVIEEGNTIEEGCAADKESNIVEGLTYKHNVHNMDNIDNISEVNIDNIAEVNVDIMGVGHKTENIQPTVAEPGDVENTPFAEDVVVATEVPQIQLVSEQLMERNEELSEHKESIRKHKANAKNTLRCCTGLQCLQIMLLFQIFN